MDAHLVVREATIGDAPTIAELRIRSAAERHSVSPDDCETFLAAARETFEARLRDRSVRVWLAFDGERAVGTATLMFLPTLPRFDVAADRDGRIRNVYVDPHYRRRGLATLLVSKAIETAKSVHVDRLTLGTSEMGRSVYERLGFAQKPDEMIYGEK
ncbi:MAG: GNAT family N-acetyltransferase [Candidatus Eremiobacteraeota bacterium]|nr:GNAT family N-acetyltransferase [Candidatus Eremiobacteraeota bacterium]